MPSRGPPNASCTQEGGPASKGQVPEDLARPPQQAHTAHGKETGISWPTLSEGKLPGPGALMSGSQN